MPNTIFNTSSSASPTPKIHISFAEILPTYLDPSQPPLRRLPFRQISNVPFAHDVTVCMPTHVYDSLYGNSNSHHDVHPSTGTGGSTSSPSSTPGGRILTYAKVIMTLSEILSNYDLRTGNYMMLAASSPGANDVTMSLNGGMLILTMPHVIHQRSGLTFPTQKVASGGQKHEVGSGRYIVSIDLRKPSMVSGRKGYERLLNAAKNVDGLREGRVWLFGEVNGGVKGEVTGRKRKRGGNGKAKGKETKGEKGSEKVRVSAKDKDDGKLASASTQLTSEIPTTTGEITTSIPKQTHPLTAHHPTIVTDPGTLNTQHSVLIPSLITHPVSLTAQSRPKTTDPSPKLQANLPHVSILDDDIHDLAEYLSLLFLGSSRITEQGYKDVDPYLCRYRLPSVAWPTKGQTQQQAGEAINDAHNQDHEEGEIRRGDDDDDEDNGDAAQEDHTVDDITRIRYSGLIPPSFITHLLIDVLRRSRAAPCTETVPDTNWESSLADQSARNPWMALKVRAHAMEKGDLDGYMLLLQGSQGTMGDGDATDILGTSARDRDTMDLDIDGRDAGPRSTGTETKQDEKKKSGQGARGFQFATCFEFVDSMIH